MTPREGGTAAVGHMSYNYTTVGPTRHQGHRRTRGGINRDTRGTRRAKGGTQETPEEPEDTRGGKEAPEGPEGKHGESERAARPGGSNSHDRCITVTPERALVSVGGCPF